MAVTGTQTVSDICTHALRVAGVSAIDEAVESETMDIAIRELENMLKAWQAKRYLTWTYTSGSLTLTTAASYTLSPVRPYRILNARFNNGSTEIPMIEMTRQEYDELPNKTSTGTPTQFHWDKGKESGTFYVWPVLSSASGQTVEFTYEREIEDIAGSSDTIDVPGEWWDAVTYNLASRMQMIFKIADPRVDGMAAFALQEVLADDVEGSVYFVDPGYRANHGVYN